MCEFISFFHNPINGDIKVYDLTSHEKTKQKLELNENIWREGHYLPDGTIEARVADVDRATKDDCNERIRNRWPTFVSFLGWIFKQNIDFSGSLDLNGLTSAQGLVLPETIGGYLDLNGLTSAQGLVLPRTISGSLYLNGLTSAQGLVLPETIGGGLYLNGLTSEEKQTITKMGYRIYQ